jgi:hypothetical protein
LKEQLQLLTDARDQMMQKLKSVKQEQETNAQCHLQELTESKERLLAELDQSVAEQQVTFSLI